MTLLKKRTGAEIRAMTKSTGVSPYGASPGDDAFYSHRETYTSGHGGYRINTLRNVVRETVLESAGGWNQGVRYDD